MVYIIIRRSSSGRLYFLDDNLRLHKTCDRAERVDKDTAESVVRNLPHTMMVSEDEALVIEAIEM